MRRPHALVIAIAMIASPVLVVSGASTATAVTNAPAPTVTPAAVLTGQTVHITGDITTPVVRKVDLQYKSGSSWKKVVSGTTDASGLYDFSQKITGSKTFRVSAPSASPKLRSSAIRQRRSRRQWRRRASRSCATPAMETPQTCRRP